MMATAALSLTLVQQAFRRRDSNKATGKSGFGLIGVEYRV